MNDADSTQNNSNINVCKIINDEFKTIMCIINNQNVLSRGKR